MRVGPCGGISVLTPRDLSFFLLPSDDTARRQLSSRSGREPDLQKADLTLCSMPSPRASAAAGFCHRTSHENVKEASGPRAGNLTGWTSLGSEVPGLVPGRPRTLTHCASWVKEEGKLALGTVQGYLPPFSQS